MSDMLKTEIVMVSPEMAEKWLETMGRNRHLNRANVERYARDIKRGNWHDNGDPVRFDKKGQLRDGQHRLTAVVEAGKETQFHVIRDMDEKALRIVDTGKQRSFADALTIQGTVPTATLARKVQAAAKLIWHYENGSILSSGQAVSHAELLSVVRRHKDLVGNMEKVAEAPQIQPHAVLGFVYTLAAELPGKKTKAKEWLTQVQEGEKLSKGSPTLVLRDLLTSQRGKGARQQLRGPYLAASVVESWNAFTRGENQLTLSWRKGRGNSEAPFPEIGA